MQKTHDNKEPVVKIENLLLNHKSWPVKSNTVVLLGLTDAQFQVALLLWFLWLFMVYLFLF